MSLQGLSFRKLSRIERATGLIVLRATVNNGDNDFRTWHFITADHRHGTYAPDTDDWETVMGDLARHSYPLCSWLFGPETRVRDDTWGVVCSDGQWRSVPS